VPGLGRRPAPDSRDTAFPLRAAVPKGLVGYKYWWDSGAWLNQGSTGTCVGHGWAHFVEDSPLTPWGTIDPFAIYKEACKLDEWSDNDDGDVDWGTSVRAGVKALVNRGLVGRYLWAFDVQTMIDAVLSQGPIVVGTDWYNSMFVPRWVAGRKTLVIDEASGVAGGHCYVVNGVSTPAEVFRVKNSWGRDWGAEGRASISFRDMGKLLDSGGEACMAVQLREST
jgi:hypothetical protein